KYGGKYPRYGAVRCRKRDVDERCVGGELRPGRSLRGIFGHFDYSGSLRFGDGFKEASWRGGRAPGSSISRARHSVWMLFSKKAPGLRRSFPALLIVLRRRSITCLGTR